MLVSKVRGYLKRTGMPRTQFGRCTINDPRLVDDLIAGRQPRPHTKAKIEAFIESHPEGVQ
ncbi:hypothetical protein JW805_12395 [Roseomonas aeriglobus]|nr:hypothetical protein [Roseomonas aeriglobus]